MSNPGIAADDSVRAAIETLLLEHPDVAAASLIPEEAADGRCYPVAYVVADPDRMREARARICQADRESRVSQWRKAFDQTYRSRRSGGNTDPGPSFVGWTNSYTNKPLPETEMQEWLDCTTDRIFSLRPKRVLEIGCGVGLLVQAVAPRCEAYAGTDLSPVAIARLREFVASKPELAHVVLSEREAVDLRDHPPGSADTVIINSVIQYFPDIQYLRSVIAEAARAVKSGGRILIGDVRHFGLLPLFHNAVQLAKAPPDASARWLKRRISLVLQQERELVLDPQFFFTLPDSEPRIRSVEVLLKRGKAHNELTRYRYDVVLHIGEAKSLQAPPEMQWKAGDHSIAQIRTQLETRQFTSAVIRNVPNRRLASDIAGKRLLWSADDRASVRTIRDALPADANFGSDPEEFWALADQGLCDVSVSWPPHSTDGRFDVTLVARDHAQSASPPRQEANLASATPGCLATDPLEAVYRQQLGLELQQILRDRLPETAMPAAVLAVNELPHAPMRAG